MITVRVLLLCFFGAATACHKDSGTPLQATPAPKARISVPVVAKKGPSAAELTVGMVEAASQGKSELPVLLKFDLKQRPTSGQPLDIDIALVPQIDAGAADIQVTGGDGLTVAPGTNQIDLPAVEAGQGDCQNGKGNPPAGGVVLLGFAIF